MFVDTVKTSLLMADCSEIRVQRYASVIVQCGQQRGQLYVTRLSGAHPRPTDTASSVSGCIHTIHDTVSLLG